jgi:hypothetical protein
MLSGKVESQGERVDACSFIVLFLRIHLNQTDFKPTAAATLVTVKSGKAPHLQSESIPA